MQAVRLSSQELAGTTLLQPISQIRAIHCLRDKTVSSALPLHTAAGGVWCPHLTRLDLGTLPLPSFKCRFGALTSLSCGLPGVSAACTPAMVQPALKFKYFPALQSLTISPLPDQRFQRSQLERLFSYGAGLRLTDVHILGHLRECPSFCLPQGCRLYASATWWCWAAGRMRLGTASRHITDLQLHMRQIDTLGGREYAGIPNVADTDELIANVSWVFEAFPQLASFWLVLRGAHEQSWLLAGIHGPVHVAAAEAQMLPSYRMENLVSLPTTSSLLASWSDPQSPPSERTVLHLNGSAQPQLAVENADTFSSFQLASSLWNCN